MANTETGAQKDLVVEARALLNRVTLPAEVNNTAPDLLRGLCDEVEAHREHLEFCFHNHVMESELTRLRERAVEIVNRFSICRDHDQPSHCVNCDLRHKTIAAIRGGKK